MGSVSPSRALIAAMLVCIGGNSPSEGRSSLRSGLALPVVESIAQASLGEEGVDHLAMTRLPSSENSERNPWPSGIATLARGRSVRASSRRISVRLPASTSTASASPVFATSTSLIAKIGGFST